MGFLPAFLFLYIIRMIFETKDLILISEYNNNFYSTILYHVILVLSILKFMFVQWLIEPTSPFKYFCSRIRLYCVLYPLIALYFVACIISFTLKVIDCKFLTIM